jgi:hypothetical protein
MKKPRPEPGKGIIGCFSLGNRQEQTVPVDPYERGGLATAPRVPARPVAKEVAWNAKVCKIGRAKLPRRAVGGERRSYPRAIPVRARINVGGRCLTDRHRPLRYANKRGRLKPPHKLPAPAVPPKPSGKKAPAVTGAEFRKLQDKGLRGNGRIGGESPSGGRASLWRPGTIISDTRRSSDRNGRSRIGSRCRPQSRRSEAA